MSFDQKCFEFAEHFLPEDASKRTKEILAQEIQTTIEDWLDWSSDAPGGLEKRKSQS